jgi:hypothetical protein
MSEQGEYVCGSWLDGEEFEHRARHGSVEVRDGCLSFNRLDSDSNDRTYLPLNSIREFVRSGSLAANV